MVGPGHGTPAILSSLELEGFLERLYPEYSRAKEGLHKFVTKIQ